MYYQVTVWYHKSELQKKQVSYWFFAGHAIGFYHEQSRPDRDRFVTVLFQNVQAGEANWFSIHF